MLDDRWRIYGAAGKWEMAVEVAGVVMKMLPARKATIMYDLAVVACRLRLVEEARPWLGFMCRGRFAPVCQAPR